MRILFFTDIHGSDKHLKEIIEKSHDADILVCSGDITIFENNLDEILRKLNSIGKPVMVINGNHESSSTVAAISMRYRNIHFIHKSSYVVGNIIFFGYGGGGFSNNDLAFDKVADNFMKVYDHLCKKKNIELKLIFVTHAPPYGTAIDDMGGGQMEWHVGCKNFTEFIKKYQPLIAVSGHIHETFGIEDRIGNTLLFNPGPKGRIMDV